MLNKINFITIILGIIMICMMINIVSANPDYFTILPKNNLGVQHNISCYMNNEFIGVIQYGDSIPINHTINSTTMYYNRYTFIIHEDFSDQIAHTENINDIAENNISYIIYILIIFMIIGLIIYFVRR